MRLQTAQRQVAVLLCPELRLAHDTPTSLVLQHAHLHSVHQLSALAILTLALRIMRTGKPCYLADRLTLSGARGRSSQLLLIPRFRLNFSHEGFINQATRLMNKLPPEIVNETTLHKQRRLLKVWVSENILIKPSGLGPCSHQ